MAEYARIVDGVVAELLTIADGTPPLSARFHPEYAAAFVAVPGGVTPAQGWTYGGGTFAAPAAPTIPPIRVIRTLAFLQRLGSPLLGALRQAATIASLPTAMGGANDPSHAAALDMIVASTQIDVDDSAITAGVAAWHTAGLLTSDQATALLANGTTAEI